MWSSWRERELKTLAATKRLRKDAGDGKDLVKIISEILFVEDTRMAERA